MLDAHTFKRARTLAGLHGRPHYIMRSDEGLMVSSGQPSPGVTHWRISPSGQTEVHIAAPAGGYDYTAAEDAEA